jgi:hypothetical protein
MRTNTSIQRKLIGRLTKMNKKKAADIIDNIVWLIVHNYIVALIQCR